MAKLITVFGATGAQCGPIARALLKKEFRVKAVTRFIDSDKARALRDIGAEALSVQTSSLSVLLGPLLEGESCGVDAPGERLVIGSVPLAVVFKYGRYISSKWIVGLISKLLKRHLIILCFRPTTRADVPLS